MLEERREEHAEDAVEVRRRGAQGDERVHGRGAVLQRRPGGGVELPAHPELHDARERPEEVAVVHPLRQEGEPLHLHRAGEDDDAEHEADGDLELELAVGGGAGRLLGVRRRLDALCARAGRRLHDVVAGAAHGRHQVLVARLAGDVRDRRLLGGQVDVGLEDAGWVPQGLLHPADTARAGHADDRQRLLRGHDAIAGALDDPDQVFGRDFARVEGHGRLLGGQVDGRLVDTVRLTDGALHPRDAARAGHAGDRQLDDGLVVAHTCSANVLRSL